MSLCQFLSLFLLSLSLHPGIYTRDVLRDYPGCGQLGDTSKKECFWGCKWVPSPLQMLKKTEILTLIEDRLNNLGGEKSASCILNAFSSTLDHPSRNLPIELAIFRLFYDIIIEDHDGILPPFSVQSPKCLENCASLEVCSDFIESWANTLFQIPPVFNKSIYGSECALELEQNVKGLQYSGLISRITEEVNFLACLHKRFRLTLDNLDGLLFVHCFASLLSESSVSCLKVMTNRNERYKFEAGIRRDSAINVNSPKTWTWRLRLGLKPNNKTSERLTGKTAEIGLSSTKQERLENTLNQYPWLCSLKTRGFRGYHRCGVTLISAPPQKTVLVSAAHCNFICKDSDGFPVETCCCRKPIQPSTCRGFNSYCGENVSLKKADPKDLNIVCSEWDNSQVSERFTPEEEVVLTVLNYTNHPLFNITEGPIGGHDLAVYFVDDQPLRKPGTIQKGRVYPACLPSSSHTGSRGIFAGWKDPKDLGSFFNENSFLLKNITVDQFRTENILRHVEVENVTCQDPLWMESNSFYPKGTICGVDPSKGSCFDTGDSGSGLMMERMQGGYSWEGSLSFYRGCRFEPDAHLELNSISGRYTGENPGVFTEGSCYLEWIANSYGLLLASGYSTGCRRESGDKGDVEKLECHAANGKKCSFNTGLFYTFTSTGSWSVGKNTTGIATDKCVLGAQGYFGVIMRYMCFTHDETLYVKCCQENSQACEKVKNISSWADVNQDSQTFFNKFLDICGLHLGLDIISSCANNCPGVRASDIVVGGVPILTSIALAATSNHHIGPDVLSINVLGLGAFGMCPGPLYCSTRQGTCCLLVGSTNDRQCPYTC